MLTQTNLGDDRRRNGTKVHDTTIYTTLRPGPRGHWGPRDLLHLRLGHNLRTLPTEHVLRL